MLTIFKNHLFSRISPILWYLAASEQKERLLEFFNAPQKIIIVTIKKQTSYSRPNIEPTLGQICKKK